MSNSDHFDEAIMLAAQMGANNALEAAGLLNTELSAREMEHRFGTGFKWMVETKRIRPTRISGSRKWYLVNDYIAERIADHKRATIL